MNSKLGLVVLGSLTLAAVAIAVFPRPEPGPEPRAAPELPPSGEELRTSFVAGRADFVVHRDLVLAFASPNVALQSDFFAWGGSEQRTEMDPGRWWAPDESWRDTPAVLAEVGLDAPAFRALKTFLARHGLLAVRKISRFEDDVAEVEFLFKQGADNSRVERVVVWHPDPGPRSQEAQYRVSETQTYPQHMRETALPAPGWFVRETVVERP
ncbi:MAG: hypothetical protein ACYTGN_03600 [Planctomycetota bacterium]|jgi:hypothetical protein